VREERPAQGICPEIVNASVELVASSKVEELNTDERG
jgi:hypothetical protein